MISPYGDRLVAGRKLAAVLGIQFDTLRVQWANMIRPIVLYEVDTINELLARSATGFVRPPTVQDLLTGQLELITAREVEQLVPRLTPKKLGRRGFRQKHLASLKFGEADTATVRYSKASVLAYANVPQSYTTTETCHIFGVRKWETVRSQLVATGRLQVIPDPDRRYHWLVPRENLLLCLRDLLPEGVDPEDWIDDRTVDPRPLVSVTEAADYIGENPENTRSLLTVGRLSYIFAPAKTERLVSIDSLLGYVEQSPITVNEVAHYFSVTRRTAEAWWYAGRLRCPVHQHIEENALYEACMVAIVRPLLSPGMGAVRWCKNRRKPSAKPLVSLRQAASLTGLSMADLTHNAETGKLHGVRSPVGGWRFSTRSLNEFLNVGYRRI